MHITKYIYYICIHINGIKLFIIIDFQVSCVGQEYRAFREGPSARGRPYGDHDGLTSPSGDHGHSETCIINDSEKTGI